MRAGGEPGISCTRPPAKTKRFFAVGQAEAVDEGARLRLAVDEGVRPGLGEEAVAAHRADDAARALLGLEHLHRAPPPPEPVRQRQPRDAPSDDDDHARKASGQRADCESIPRRMRHLGEDVPEPCVDGHPAEPSTRGSANENRVSPGRLVHVDDPATDVEAEADHAHVARLP